MFVSAKNTLSRHQPTNLDPGSVSTTSVQNKHTCTKCKQPKQSVHADRSQEIQHLQTNANKTFSSQRLCVWRQACFIMAPKTGSKEPVETWRPERDLDCSHVAVQATRSLQFSKRAFQLVAQATHHVDAPHVIELPPVCTTFTSRSGRIDLLGRPIFAPFSYVLRSKNGSLLCHIVLLQFP